jgi:4-hydroxy-tetrahydrodipicolinate synthase
MTRRIDWTGLFVVAVTPFSEDGKFDEAATRALVGTLIAEGADGLVLAGSTGEWFSMTDAERVELFRVAADEAKGRVLLLAGISAIATPNAVHLALEAKRLGLDGALVLPPPYILPTERELLAFFEAIDRVGLPLMVYNNPPRTGVNLDAKWLRKLMAFKSVVALKESVKDIGQISDTLKQVGRELAVFSGIETYAIPSLQRGGAGVVAMAPNVLGARAIEFYRSAATGNWKRAIELQPAIDDLYAQMYGAGVNPYVVQKEAMRMLGRPGGWPRPPLMSMNESERGALRAVLARIGTDPT